MFCDWLTKMKASRLHLKIKLQVFQVSLRAVAYWNRGCAPLYCWNSAKTQNKPKILQCVLKLTEPVSFSKKLSDSTNTWKVHASRVTGEEIFGHCCSDGIGSIWHGFGCSYKKKPEYFFIFYFFLCCWSAAIGRSGQACAGSSEWWMCFPGHHREVSVGVSSDRLALFVRPDCSRKRSVTALPQSIISSFG